MRVSQYNIYNKLKQNDNTWLIIQGVKGSFDLVDGEIVKILKSSETNQNDLNALREDQKVLLLDRGYITQKSVEEEFSFVEILGKAINNIARKGINITFVPTYNCNFRCEYCFERKLQTNGQEWLNKKMSPMVVDSVFEQLQKYKDEGKRLESVYLFGGEPLLHSNVEIITYICEKAHLFEIPISCISNGFYLHEYIEIIKNFNFVSVQITLDGIEEEHNKRRFLLNGKGTYNRIISNIDKALNEGIHVVLRTNVNQKNVDQIRNLIELYTQKGWTQKENFRYYFKSTLRCYEEPQDELSDIELMQLLGDVYGEGADKFQYNSIYGSLSSRLMQMFESNSFAPMRSGYCGANMGMYTVDPFGDIYPCWDVLAESNCVIGHVDTENNSFTLNNEHDKWKERTVDKIMDCRQCKYMLFCGGGCAAQSLVTHNSMNKAFCDNFQQLFDECSVEVCELYLNKQKS